jgi:hypothetical protein
MRSDERYGRAAKKSDILSGGRKLVDRAAGRRPPLVRRKLPVLGEERQAVSVVAQGSVTAKVRSFRMRRDHGQSR